MALMGFVAAPARAEAVIHIGYLRWTEPRLAISLLDRPAADDGLAGARLALADNNSTGSFIGQRYEWQTIPVRAGDDVVGALNRLADDGIGLVLTDAPAPTILQLAPVASQRGITLFNIAAPDDALREENCSAAVIHVAPSRSMLADALAQYLVWKKWSRWVLAAGSHPDDALLADAYRRAAQRFGARIVKEIIYKDTGGSRQTDTGLLQTQQQMPVFTQGLPEYDVLVAADENEVFAGYLPYRTWDPRPVAGSAGLRPVTWDASSESWGGTQVQDRFRRMFHRGMTPLDMQAWTAMRLIGEAASRGGAEPQKLIGQLRSPDFGVGAHKGQKLTLRAWNGQLRQPILLSDGRNVVSVSPQPGFLHQVNELDTLGVDRPETRCKLP
ncbi:ABC transporter substrate-binding protein [Rhodovastum atsumiense]|uniref:ABC transporter substrate-binding protein n=2 Tax=Rhodovastum atsumiense TaxID=504468 RepID=A0A5M6IQR0_9PROT|nr:ABC transporter substrate-binding protein [Rhodovastum atsumiense]